jgi:hypothetical protein
MPARRRAIIPVGVAALGAGLLVALAAPARVLTMKQPQTAGTRRMKWIA